MLVIPGRPGKDLCDPNLATSRRAILRAGSIGLFGMSLPNILRLEAAAAPAGVLAPRAFADPSPTSSRLHGLRYSFS